jgi:hypothetical protein
MTEKSSQTTTWEIYGVGEPAVFAWSWRCYRRGIIRRRGVFMFSNMQDAIEDAAANGMDTTLHVCRVIDIDGSKDIAYPFGSRTELLSQQNVGEHALQS